MREIPSHDLPCINPFCPSCGQIIPHSQHQEILASN
jgi:hypothetical protein